MMGIRKIMIGVVLTSAMISSAMVYHAIASRHHQVVSASVPPVQQTPTPTIPKPPAGTPLDAAPDADAPDPQLADADSGQAPDDDQADSPDSDQDASIPAPAPVRYRVYTVPAARIRPVVRVVHANSPADAPLVAAVATEISHPVTGAANAALAHLLVPAGTSLTIRLSEPLGSKTSETDQSFAATLDRDIDVNGRIAVAAGAPVIGKVVLARCAGPLAGEADLKIKLTSININNHEFDVLTSVEKFGSTIQGKSKFGRFMKSIGKRVDGNEHEVELQAQTAYTFTLSQPLQLH